MDYRRFAVHHPELETLTKDLQYDIYHLILSGAPKDYLEYVIQEPMSVSRYCRKLGIVQHKSYFVFYTKMKLCCGKQQMTYTTPSNCWSRCLHCKTMKQSVDDAEYLSSILGKEQFDRWFHLYYLFSHYELLDDVKKYIRYFMF